METSGWQADAGNLQAPDVCCCCCCGVTHAAPRFDRLTAAATFAFRLLEALRWDAGGVVMATFEVKPHWCEE